MRLEGTSGHHLVQPPFAEQGQVEYFGLESESRAHEKPCGLSDEGKCTWLFRSLVALTPIQRQGRRAKCDGFVGKRMWLPLLTNFQVFTLSIFVVPLIKHLSVCPPLRLETDTKSQKYFAGLNDMDI